MGLDSTTETKTVNDIVLKGADAKKLGEDLGLQVRPRSFSGLEGGFHCLQQGEQVCL